MNLKRQAGLTLVLLLGVASFASDGRAQGCGSNNPNCIVTTMPLGDASNRAASDAFVQNAISASAGVPQSANKVLAGPTSGGALPPSFRLLVGADLPPPGASSLGGVQSLTCSASNWFSTLSTGGVLGCSQPNFNNLLGTIAGAQIPSSTITSAMIVDGTIVDADVSASAAIAGSKITTVSNSVAGVVPALPNDGTKFFNGVGAYATPPSAGQMILLNTLTASASATLSDTTSLTATYSSYEIVFQNLVPATTGVNLQFQVHSGGSFQTTAYLTTTFGAGGASMGMYRQADAAHGRSGGLVDGACAPHA